MKKSLLYPVILVTAFAALGADAEQMVVSEARGVSLAPGSVIDPTKPLMLKPGQHLTLISESGRTIHIDGPYQKPPAAEQGVALASALRGLVTEQNARSNELGTTRSATQGAPLPQPWLIDATRSGNACLREGERPLLWRPIAHGAATLAIMPADRSWRADAQWPAGETSLSLDPALAVHGDASYFFALDGAETAVHISTVPANLTNDQMRIAWMVDKGCDRQAEALLRTPK